MSWRFGYAAALLAAVLGVATGWAQGRPAEAPPAPGSLTRGVTQIAAPGVPGPLCVFGSRAFPVVAAKVSGDRLAPVVAGARFGKGRVVAFGHPGYLDAKSLEVADTGTLMANAISWVAGRDETARSKIRVTTVRHPPLAAFLQAQGFVASDVDRRGLAAALETADVVMMDVVEIADAREGEAIVDYVKKGRGLVVASLGWGWSQLNPGKSLVDDHPGNRFLSAMGIAWADGYLSRTADAGYAIQAELPALLHTGRALQAMLEHDQGRKPLEPPQVAQATTTLSLAIRTLPEDASALSPLRTWASQHAGELVPTPQKPIGLDAGLRRLALAMETVQSQRLRADQVQAHPAAAVFPGAVPREAERVRSTLRIDTTVPGWHSTGLYAPPGEVIEIVTTEQAIGKGLDLRIGCHSDRLWDTDQWRRCPEICLRRPLAEPVTRIASPFGGLIYIEVSERCKLGTIPVEVRGAVQSPYFLLGVTSAEEWRRIRDCPAPWAELACERVIVTVPSKWVRLLEDPQAVMAVWNQVLDACADLAAIPRERRRPERYVADEQISAGYMHSGYPIMTHLDAAESMVSRDRLLGGNWGLFHEMGHNHQSGDWTFEGAVEVTCNLFSLYVTETVCRLNHPGHPAVLVGPRRAKAFDAYAATGPDFRKWQSDPFLALTMYLQLREGFGWDAYKRVFAEYRQLRADERPGNDQEKRDQWMVRFSKAVGRNLGPFFQAWGVPVSDSARTAVADLPTWMPAGFPPE